MAANLMRFCVLSWQTSCFMSLRVMYVSVSGSPGPGTGNGRTSCS